MFEQGDGTMPAWLTGRLSQMSGSLPDVEARMRLAIEFSRLNVEHGSGGPFGAAVFDMQDWRLIAAGVNRVVPLNSSIAHAEMLAISAAQRTLGSFDLGAAGLPHCELVTSCEPCAMCFGALPWSGIRRVVCGAASEDAERIGFDEGPRHPDWVGQLESRGIEVVTGVCRAEAAAVLSGYGQGGGPIYNARRD